MFKGIIGIFLRSGLWMATALFMKVSCKDIIEFWVNIKKAGRDLRRVRQQ